VLVAQDGETGIERAKLLVPDLILLDILLPGMDGFEICRHLKADPAVQDMPVIFITAYVDDIDRKVAGFEAGAVDYITKPFNEAEVAARVAAHVRIYEVRTYAAGLEEVAPLLREGFAPYPEAAHYQGHLDGVEETVAQMNDLTQRMLILIHEDTLPPSQQQPIDLSNLLEHVQQSTVAFAQLCDFSIRIRLLKMPELVIYGDPLYLGMACNTGLRNAVEILIEHEQDADAQVEINVTAQDGHVNVRLSDNGPGFPPALLEAIALARQNEGGFVIGWRIGMERAGLGWR
jgi:CheY-like chemotaxis protein